MKVRFLVISLLAVNSILAMNLSDEEKMNDTVISLYNEIKALAVETPTIYFPGPSPFIKVRQDLLGFNQFSKSPSYLQQVEILEKAVLIDFPQTLDKNRETVTANLQHENKELLIYGILTIGLFSLGYSRYMNGSTLFDCTIKRGLSYFSGIISGFVCYASFKQMLRESTELDAIFCRINSYKNYKVGFAGLFGSLKSCAPTSPGKTNYK